MGSSVPPTGGPINYKNVVLKSSLIAGNFNFLHINPGSLSNHLDELRGLINGTDLHVIAVSETWFKPKHNDNLLAIHGFNLLRHDRKNKRGGGVALYIKKDLSHRIIRKSHPNAISEFLIVELSNGLDTKLAFGVIYNPPPNTNIEHLKTALLETTGRYPHALFIGDFNINFSDNASTSRKFKDFLYKINLHSPSNAPTNFVPGKNPSQIDLLLVNQKALLKRFSQISPGSFTSHDVIYGSYGVAFHISPPTEQTFLDFNRVDKKSLNERAFELNWNAIYSMENVDDQVDHLTSLLSSLVAQCVPIRKISSQKCCRPPWFSDELQKLINNRDFLFKSSCQERNPAIKNELKTKFRKLRNEVNSLKTRLKARYTNNQLRINQPPKKLWANLKSHGIVKDLRNSNGDLPASEFNDYFSSNFSVPTVHNVLFNQRDDRDSVFEFTNVTDEEVFNALMAIKTNAIGEDGIPASFIKNLCPLIIPFLTHIINACLTKSYFPKAWKIANVIPIPKEPNPQSVESFRPISILPAMSKIIERVMKNQMQDFVSHNNLLFKFQSGFRERYSTNTAMLTVVNDLANAIEQGKVTALVLLDLKKAFDLVDHETLLRKLHTKFRFSSRTCKLLQSYLSDRYQRVKLGDDFSNLAPVHSGTPQGGVLSALLFTLFINDIAESISIQVHLYADDSQLYCSAPIDNVNDCIEEMNAELAKLMIWAIDNKVIINPLKSQAILISNKSIKDPPPIFLGNDSIDYVNKVKVLGVMLNNKLTWDDHVMKVRRDIFATLSMLRQTQHLITQSLRLKLVKTLVVPRITYCSNIFMGCSRKLWNQLNVSFNSCARYIYQTRSRDPVSKHAYDILNCTLEHYIQYQACLFIFNLMRTNCPSYLAEKLTQSRLPRGNTLQLPISKTLRTDQFTSSFFVMGIRLWNELDSKLRKLEASSAFRQQVFSYFASKMPR